MVISFDFEKFSVRFVSVRRNVKYQVKFCQFVYLPKYIVYKLIHKPTAVLAKRIAKGNYPSKSFLKILLMAKFVVCCFFCLFQSV